MSVNWGADTSEQEGGGTVTLDNGLVPDIAVQYSVIREGVVMGSITVEVSLVFKECSLRHTSLTGL